MVANAAWATRSTGWSLPMAIAGGGLSQLSHARHESRPSMPMKLAPARFRTLGFAFYRAPGG